MSEPTEELNAYEVGGICTVEGEVVVYCGVAKNKQVRIQVGYSHVLVPSSAARSLARKLDAAADLAETLT